MSANQPRLWPSDVFPQFDPNSRHVYLILAFVLPVEFLLFFGMGFRLDPAPSPYPIVGMAILIVAAGMFRRARWTRTADALEIATLLSFQGLAATLLQYPLATIAIGSPDDLLLAADKMLGFDWIAFADYFSSPAAIEVLRHSYRSMFYQFMFCAFVLPAIGLSVRAWQFVTASVVCVLFCVLPFPFFAAEGAYAGCKSAFPMIEDTCNFAIVIQQIRAAGPIVLEPWMQKGLVSFPSFHAAAGLLCVWAVWPIRHLRAPFLLLNAAMSVGAIVIGKHYFVDIPAGYAAAVIAIVLARRLPIRRPLARSHAPS